VVFYFADGGQHQNLRKLVEILLYNCIRAAVFVNCVNVKTEISAETAEKYSTEQYF